MKSNKLFKQFASVGIGSLINMVIGLFTTPLITRLIDPSEYGQLSIFNTYSNICMMIIGLGLDQVLLRYYYVNNDIKYKQSLITKVIFLPVLFFGIAIVPIIILLYINDFFHSLKTRFFIIMFLVEIVCLLVNRISILIIRLNGKATLYSLLSVVQKVIYVVVAIPLILIIKEKYIYILIIATFLSYLVPTSVAIITERENWKFNFLDKYENLKYKELLNYGLPMLLASSIYLFFQATDKICLQYFCTFSDVGIYASAASIMSIIAIIRTSFTTVWTPIAVRHYEKFPDDIQFYVKINEIITFIMFVFGLSLMFGKDLIVILLGEKYRKASLILPYLLFQPIMYTISETTVVGLIFKKKSNMQLISSLGACIFNLLLNIILIPSIGATGASISTGISYIVFYILRTTFSNKYFPVPYYQKKISIAIIMTIFFAVYISLTTFGIITVIFYFICLVLLSILYKDVVEEGIKKINTLDRRKIKK